MFIKITKLIKRPKTENGDNFQNEKDLQKNCKLIFFIFIEKVIVKAKNFIINRIVNIIIFILLS